MTKLLPESAWPEIEEHLGNLIARQILPAAMDRLASPMAS